MSSIMDERELSDSDDIVVLESEVDDGNNTNSRSPRSTIALSSDAREFVPSSGTCNQPSPPFEAKVDSEFLPGGKLRTSPETGEINELRINKEGEQSEAPDAADSSKTNVAGWKVMAKPNRRRVSGGNRGSRSAACHERPADLEADKNLPGEYLTVDGNPRYVVWSRDLESARRAIAVNRRAMVIMRGVPGSGKSTLARSLQSNGIISSADDYFIKADGSYCFDRSRIPDAHAWCLQRVVQAMAARVSPIIVDNTNIHLWEMAKYVKLAVRNFYDLYFLEPETPWKFNARACSKRNSHAVGVETIERMILEFEPVVALRPFTVAGQIRMPTSKTCPAVLKEPIEAVGRDVDKMLPSLVLPSLQRGSPADCESKSADVSVDWDLEDSSSAWGIEEPQKATSLPPNLPALESCGPKDQRVARSSVEGKKTDGNGRRKRKGYEGVSLGAFVTGPWSLPDDLTGGLEATSTGALPKPAQLTATACEIRVRDCAVQVSEKHLALANLSHRRLTRPSVNEVEEDCNERSVAKWAQMEALLLKCDRSVQCDIAMAVEDADGYQRAMDTLQSCFPQVPQEDVEDIFERCGFQLEWAVNVMLDSGYDIDWSTKVRRKENAARKQSLDDGKVEMEKDDYLDDKATNVEDSNHSSSSVEPNKIASGKGKSAIIVEDQEADNPVFTMELSIDMATQLQQIFTPIFPDIPPEILSPMQLKLRIPQHIAAELYRCWLEAQVKDGGYSDGDSDFFSEGSVDDIYDSPSAEGGVVDKTEEDVFCIEKQIWMDEQLARQIALEQEQNMELERETAKGRRADSLASKIKLRRLQELFPSVDQSFLKSIFSSNDYNLDQTIDTLCRTYNIPKSVSASYSPSPSFRTSRKVEEVQSEDSTGHGELVNHTYEQSREDAFFHYEQRQHNFKKAQDYYRRGMASVAYYYAQKGHLHNSKFKEANERAARRILQHRKATNPPDVLDLHGLHVTEAVRALVETLREYENRPGKQVKLITGQGLHSAHGPKIKPAVVNYLRQRGYSYMELSPGVLVVKIK